MLAAADLLLYLVSLFCAIWIEDRSCSVQEVFRLCSEVTSDSGEACTAVS